MAVGNESDLQVKISVNTEEVRSGFEKIASMADDLVRDVESRLSKLDFSRVFDTSKISSSLTTAVSEVTKNIKPIEIRTKVKAPRVPSGKVVSEGGMASVDAVRERVRGKSVEAEESKAMAKKETHTQIIGRYVRALREQATALERVRQLEEAVKRVTPGDELRGTIEAAAEKWRQRAGIFGGVASGIEGKYGSRKWFSNAQQIGETKSLLAAQEAERKAKAEEEEHVRVISKYVSALNEQARALERVKDLQYELSKVDKEKQPQLYASIQSAIASWQGHANNMGSRASGIAEANKGNAWFGLSERVAETKESIRLMETEKEVSREKKRQADEAAAKAKAEREALAYIAAATQLYRIASRIVSRVVNAFRGWIDVSNEIYQSQLKLGAALRVGYDVTNGQVRATYAMVENLSKANGLSLEMNYSAAQMMASYVGTSEELGSMMGALDDLVVKMYGFNATSEQARMLAKQLGRALSGNVDILQRHGIVLTENEKAILKSSTVERAEKIKVLTAAIARVTGDMSQESRTWAGVMGRIRVYGEIIKNNLGQAFQNALKPMLDVIVKIAEGLATISEFAVSISKFAFGNNIKGAEELSGTLSDVNDLLDKIKTRLLGFDKFNVLSGDSVSSIIGDKKDGSDAGDGNESVKEEVEGLSDMQTFWLELTGPIEAVKLALTGIAVTLGTIVTLSGILMAAGFVGKLKNLVSTLNLSNAGISITKANLIGLTSGITLLITGVTTLISTFDALNNWDELTGWEKATTIFKLIAGSAMALGGAMITLTSLMKIFGKTAIAEFFKAGVAAKVFHGIMNALNSSMGMFVAILAVAASFTYFISSLNDMSNAARVLIPIISVLIGLMTSFAVAKAAAQSGIAAGPVAIATAGMLASALAMAIGTAMATSNKAKSVGTITAHANGGIPDRGQLFIANEQGPELIGQIGGRTSVANNSMIVEAIEEAAYRGFSRASENGGGGNVTLTLQGEGVRNDALVRALMPALKTEVRRQGGIKKAFGGE